MSKKSSNWYKSHINDEFVKLANKGNWRSRAVFKLKEIDEKYNLIKEESNILDLGSAPGGWSQYASKKLKNASSLKIEYGSDYEREIIISSIVDRLELNLNLFPNNLKKIIHDWEAVCCHINKNINFKNHTKSGEGKFLGLDDDGSVKIIVNEKIERFSDLQII